MNKQNIIQSAYTLLKGQLEKIRQQVKGAKSESVEAEGAMQSRYSTFKEEAQYLHQGLAYRFNEANDMLSKAERMSRNPDQATLFILAAAEEDKETFLVVSPIGGISVECEGHEVTFVTTNAPLAQRLVALEEGDTVEIADKEYFISEIL